MLLASPLIPVSSSSPFQSSFSSRIVIRTTLWASLFLVPRRFRAYRFPVHSSTMRNGCFHRMKLMLMADGSECFGLLETNLMFGLAKLLSDRNVIFIAIFFLSLSLSLKQSWAVNRCSKYFFRWIRIIFICNHIHAIFNGFINRMVLSILPELAFVGHWCQICELLHTHNNKMAPDILV
jgi:hypothetical protein